MTTRTTKKTEDATEAAARAALGFVPAGKPAEEDREAAARTILAVQPAAPAPEPEGKPEPKPAEPADPAPAPAPQPQPAVKAAQAEPGDGEGEPGDGEPGELEAEQLEGETFSKAAVTEIAARAYRRGATSKKVKTMEDEIAQLKAQLAEMQREKTVSTLASEYGVEPELLGATKLEGEELQRYAEKLAEAQPKQQELFGFQSVRAAVNARAAQPMDGWSQLAAALR